MMRVTSTCETNGLDIDNIRKCGVRMKTGDERKSGTALRKKELKGRGRQPKLREHGEWKRRNERLERKRNAKR